MTAATGQKKTLTQQQQQFFKEAHLTRVLVGVATVCIVTAILGAAAHITRTDIHQSRSDKRNQADKWWLENWRIYAQPELEEIKALIKEKQK